MFLLDKEIIFFVMRLFDLRKPGNALRFHRSEERAMRLIGCYKRAEINQSESLQDFCRATSSAAGRTLGLTNSRFNVTRLNKTGRGHEQALDYMMTTRHA